MTLGVVAYVVIGGAAASINFDNEPVAGSEKTVCQSSLIFLAGGECDYSAA